MISYPAPALVQGDDEELLLEIAEIVLPGSLRRHAGENGLRIWVDGSSLDHPEAGVRALAAFQVSLGVLRAWDWEAGKLANEERRGLAGGSVRDEQGNQYIFLSAIFVYGDTSSALSLAESARLGVAASHNLETSLWLHGRENRTAADFYMIYECARQEFETPNNITAQLGISGKSQSRLRTSINNMSPLHGGRHATGSSQASMDLEAQAKLISDLLRAWLSLY